MTEEKPIILKRECVGVLIPSGEKVALAAGSTVWLTQALGGSYTVMTDRGHMARIDRDDADALGSPHLHDSDPAGIGASVEETVWNQLRTCFDPEIPVNIVDLGLIYDCRVDALENGQYKAIVQFTLTAQGCGMGQFLKEDIKKKILAIPEIHEADVDLVWEPPWNQSMISANAKHQLGIE
jgi:probable FeS assembly SUF system protein SufT